MLFRVVILCLVVVASGCMATGPVFTRIEPPFDGKATIYVFRKSDLYSFGGIFPDMKIDGNGKYPLKNNGYLRFEVDPGKHRIEIISELKLSQLVTWPYRDITVDATAGGVNYVVYDVRTDGKEGNTTLLQTAFFELTEAQALPILAQTKKIQ